MDLIDLAQCLQSIDQGVLVDGGVAEIPAMVVAQSGDPLLEADKWI